MTVKPELLTPQKIDEMRVRSLQAQCPYIGNPAAPPGGDIHTGCPKCHGFGWRPGKRETMTFMEHAWRDFQALLAHAAALEAKLAAAEQLRRCQIKFALDHHAKPLGALRILQSGVGAGDLYPDLLDAGACQMCGSPPGGCPGEDDQDG